MTTFIATYTTPTGRARKLTLQADTMVGARRELRRRGILPNSLLQAEAREVKAASSAPEGLNLRLAQLFERRPGIKDKALFANQLSALVNAGVPLLRGLNLMADQQKNHIFKRALKGVSYDVNQGGNLGAAMRRWPQVFDNLTVAMVDAGEAGGVLDDSLKRLAKLLEDNARLQNQIKSALTYPIAVFVIAILVFLGMTIFLIPIFADLFNSLGAELPWFTQLMVNLSSLLRSSFSLIVIAAILIAIFLFSRYYATPTGRRQVDGFLLKIPLFGDLIQKTSTAQFCRILSSLSRAGVPILYSLEVVRETTGNRVVSDAIAASRIDVMEGTPLSKALESKNVFPQMAMSMLVIGEETGEMDMMLSKVADFYEDEVTNAVKSLTSLIEPFMIVIVGGIVGVILIAMYLPMFSIFDNIR